MTFILVFLWHHSENKCKYNYKFEVWEYWHCTLGKHGKSQEATSELGRRRCLRKDNTWGTLIFLLMVIMWWMAWIITCTSIFTTLFSINSYTFFRYETTKIPTNMSQFHTKAQEKDYKNRPSFLNHIGEIL